MNKNRFIAMAISISMGAGLVATASAATFRDTQGNWASQEINTLTDAGIMTGYNDGMFHPDAWITRSEFTNMSLKTLNLPPSRISTAPGVQKVSKNTWNFSDVSDQSQINQYPSGVYRPSNPVRRVEVMAALGESLNQPLVSSAEADRILMSYPDAGQIPANARRQVATAIHYNLVENNPAQANMLDPMEPATRAEVAAMLNNLYEQPSIAVTYNPATASGAQMTTRTTTTRQIDQSGVTTTRTTTRDIARQPVAPMQQQTMQRQAAVGMAPSDQDSFTLAPNTTFTGTVARSLYSEYNQPGDEVLLILDHALFDANGKVIAPAGSRVHGEITDVTSYNFDRDPASISMTFDKIITPTGDEVVINGRLAANQGQLSAEDLQGIVIKPNRSIKGLEAQVRSAEGSLVGTEQGKVMSIKENSVMAGWANVRQIAALSRGQEIVVGVGDTMQVELSGPVGKSQVRGYDAGDEDMPEKRGFWGRMFHKDNDEEYDEGVSQVRGNDLDDNEEGIEDQLEEQIREDYPNTEDVDVDIDIDD